MEERNLSNLCGHKDIIWSISIFRNYSLFATASCDKTIKIWDCDGILINTIESGNVNSLEYKNSNYLFTGTWGKHMRIWDIQTKKCLVNNSIHSDFVSFVALSNDLSKLATASWDKSIKIWNFSKFHNDNSLFQKANNFLLKFDGHKDHVNTIAWSFDDKLLASASSDRTLRFGV